jgi:hypothetical protein
MTRHSSIRALLILALTLVVGATAVPTTAQAGDTDVKFTVTEYRLDQGKDLYKMIGEVRIPIIELEFRGTAKMFDAQVEVKWKVEDAEPYLKLLNSCSGGRLNALVEADFDAGDKKITGTGDLVELRCRRILR